MPSLNQPFPTRRPAGQRPASRPPAGWARWAQELGRDLAALASVTVILAAALVVGYTVALLITATTLAIGAAL